MSELPRVLSLCTGYGGIELALGEIDLVAYAEFDKYASMVMAHHHPDVPNLGDIKAHHNYTKATLGDIDILTAGYPCQPFSHAGKQLGAADPRHLWPDVAQIIRQLRPGVVFLENVRGHVRLGLKEVIAELAHLGYVGSWRCVRASDVGAAHRRERVFIVAADASSESDGTHPRAAYGDETRDGEELADRLGGGRGIAADASRSRRAGWGGVVSGDQEDGAGSPDHGDQAVPDSDHGRCEQQCPSVRYVPVPVPDGPRPGSYAPSPLHWGQFDAAVRRWEGVLGRGAPTPTEPGTRRLNPEFVEWMMGLPRGHVTGIPNLSRTRQLKILGNGVVPQQARHAWNLLIPR